MSTILPEGTSATEKVRLIAQASESSEEFLTKLKERQHDLWMEYAGRDFPPEIVRELKEISPLIPEIVLHKTQSLYFHFGREYHEYWSKQNF